MRLGKVVLDSSVVLKWLKKDEEHTQCALRLLDKHVKGDLTVLLPDLAIYEIANVLRYASRLGGREIQHTIAAFFKLHLQIFSPRRLLVDKAIDLALTHAITVYDSVYVALAELTQSDFITADQKLYTALGKNKRVHFLASVASLY